MNRSFITPHEWPAAAHAKSLLYLIKGETIGFTVPIMPRESRNVGNSKDVPTDLVRLYPNPANQSINIEVLTSNLRLVKIEILNLQGGSLKAIETNTNIQNLDISAFANGTYILRLELSDGTKVNKSIQIQH